VNFSLIFSQPESKEKRKLSAQNFFLQKYSVKIYASKVFLPAFSSFESSVEEKIVSNFTIVEHKKRGEKECKAYFKCLKTAKERKCLLVE
jgi:hypothetical protein